MCMTFLQIPLLDASTLINSLIRVVSVLFHGTRTVLNFFLATVVVSVMATNQVAPVVDTI